MNLFEIKSKAEIALGNVYFDTPSLDLRRLDMGLRIRRSGDCSEQTIKCRGQAVGGLHARPEYNLPVIGEVPTLAAFPADIWPSLALRDDIQANLIAQFRTDFVRQHWLIACEGAEIELAWDRGEIVGPLGRSEIDELELELKSGSTHALFVLAERLASLDGLRLGAQSKAQRGYLLAGLGKPLAQQPLPELDGLAAEARIALALQHWQHHEQLWLEAQGDERRQALQEIRRGMVTIAETLNTLDESLPWLPALSEHLSALDRATGDGPEALSALYHKGDYVRLQLAIAAWLHLGS